MTVKVGDLVHIRANGSFLIRPLTGLLVSSRFTRWSETIPFHRILTGDGTLLEVPYARPEDWEVINEETCAKWMASRVGCAHETG